MTLQAPPGPPAGWLGLKFITRFRDEPLALLSELARDYGDVAFVRAAHLRLCFVQHPDLAHEVLVAQGKNFLKQAKILDVFRQVDGDSVFTTEGAVWLRRRRLVQKAFQPGLMAGYARQTGELTRQALDCWQDGATLDFVDAMTHLTLKIICRTMFGLDASREAPELGAAVRVLSEAFTREAGKPWRWPLWTPLPSVRRKRQAIATLHGLIEGVIRRRRAEPTEAGDLLSLLLRAVDDEGDGRGLDDLEVRNEAVTMFNAGHDTTAAALSWAGYLLATHPEVQEALAAEVREVLGDRPPELADLPRLTGIDRAVKETLRLYPPAWILAVREAQADTRLGDYAIPRGSWVYISPYALGRDPRWFDDPERFDPDRFAPERAGSIPRGAYLPFGAGPHLCVGQAFAGMEMGLVLASLVARFRLELASDQGPVEAEPVIALRPRGGLRLRLVARTPIPAVAAG